MTYGNLGATRRPERPESLLRSIVSTYRLLVSTFEPYVGMSQARVQLLSHFLSGEELSQTALQRRLGVDRAVITRQVKQLEAEGVLSRRCDPSDNRFTLVTLTSAGRLLLDDLIRKRSAFEAIAKAGLSPEEIDQLQTQLRRVRQYLSEFAVEKGFGDAALINS